MKVWLQDLQRQARNAARGNLCLVSLISHTFWLSTVYNSLLGLRRCPKLTLDLILCLWMSVPTFYSKSSFIFCWNTFIVAIKTFSFHIPLFIAKVISIIYQNYYIPMTHPLLLTRSVKRYCHGNGRAICYSALNQQNKFCFLTDLHNCINI